MGLFDWISKQVDKQVEFVQQARKEKAAVEKAWLANPYGMDAGLQKRLIAEATKKREDEMASQLARLPSFFDPNEDYQKELAEYNERKIREDKDRKGRDEEFEKRRRQRIEAEPRTSCTPQAALAAGAGVKHFVKKESKVIPGPKFIPGPVITIPQTTIPSTTSARSSSSSQTVEKISAQLQAVELAEDSITVQPTGTDGISHVALPRIDLVRQQRTPVPGSLAFLRNDHEFLEMRGAIQQQPELLIPFIEKIKVGNPELASLLFHNEDEFRELLAEARPNITNLPAELEFLENDLKFSTLRRKIQHEPERLGWAMRKLIEQQPYQAAVIACNEAYFIEWLNIGSSVRIIPIAQPVSTPDWNAEESTTNQDTISVSNLGFLRDNVEFLRIRSTYQARPEMLKWLAGKFIANNPHLKFIATSNEAEFLHLMNEGFVPPTEGFTEPASTDLELSPLSQRIRQAEENAAYNSGEHSSKNVRFSDSAIRGDNNMDISPTRNLQTASPNIQNMEFWMTQPSIKPSVPSGQSLGQHSGFAGPSIPSFGAGDEGTARPSANASRGFDMFAPNAMFKNPSNF